MSGILYVAWPLKIVYESLVQSEMFILVMNGALYPFVQLGSYLFAFLKLMFDLLWPIKAFISLILRYSLSFIWNILCLPYTILSLCYSGTLGLFTCLKSFSSSFSSVKSVSSSDAQEAFSMIAYGTQLCI